jgi:CheY-like chemotaxis protein
VLIDSVAGKGAAISLRLPRLSAELQPVAGPEASDENAVGGRGTVLIVDDNELVRGTMEMMTESLGYQVLTASGAAEALRLIGGGASVDIMISDIVMWGEINRLELAHRVRSLHLGLPLLLVSGYPAAGIEEACGYPILGKPCRRDEVGRQSGQPAIGASVRVELRFKESTLPVRFSGDAAADRRCRTRRSGSRSTGA